MPTLRFAHEKNSINVLVRVCLGNNGCTTLASIYSFNTALLHSRGSVALSALFLSRLPSSLRVHKHHCQERFVSRSQRTIALILCREFHELLSFFSWQIKRCNSWPQLHPQHLVTPKRAPAVKGAHGPTDLLQVVTALARLGFAHDRHLQEIENLMTLTIWIYDATNANRAPGYPSSLGGQSFARRTSSQWNVSTGGDVVQIDHCITPSLRCTQTGGSTGAPFGTKRKSNPQNGWRTNGMGRRGGSLGPMWTGHNTVPFRNRTQPNRTGNFSPQAHVQRTSPGQALDLEPGQHLPQLHWNSNRTSQHWQLSVRIQN